MENKKKPEQKGFKKEEIVLKHLEKKFPLRKESSIDFKKIFHCLFIGNGASLLYSLSVLSVIYGLVGILTPLFCVKNVLKDKLICIGTLQGYEILLVLAAIVPFVKKKITKDSVSLIIFIAMFLVVGAITLDTISNDGYMLSKVIGISWLAFAGGKIFMMKKSLKMKFHPLLVSGLMTLLLWNYLASPVIAEYHLSIAPTSTNIPFDLWEFWRMCWLMFLFSGLLIWFYSVSAPNIKSINESNNSTPFLHSSKMTWIFTGILYIASMYHQRVLCYVYDIPYHIADFLPALIILIFICAETVWIYRTKYFNKAIKLKENGLSKNEKNNKSKSKHAVFWLKTGCITEKILYGIPLVLIIILCSAKSDFSVGTYWYDIFWNPIFMLICCSALLIYDLLHFKRSYLIYHLIVYFFVFILICGASYGFPQTFNWKLSGMIVIFFLIILGLLRKNIYIAMAGLLLGVSGIFYLTGAVPNQKAIKINELPAFLSACSAIIIFFYLIIKEKFPRKAAVFGITVFCLFIMFCYDGKSGIDAYRITAGLFTALIGIVLIKRLNDLPCGITMQFPILIYGITKIEKMNYWDFIILGFIMLFMGGLYSIYKDLIEKNVKQVFCAYRIKFLKNPKKKNDPVILMIPIIALILILIWSFFTSIGIARESARKISCTSNLKCIGLSLRMYSNVYDEAYPHLDGAAGLDLLRSEGFLENAHVFICPSTEIEAEYPLKKLTEANTSYCFRGGLTEASSVDSALAWDKPNNHDKYGNILYVDGHVKGYAGADWMDNIK